MSLIALMAPFLLSFSELEWDITYESWSDGPRVVYMGMANLYMTDENRSPCLEYTFDIPETGWLSGPAVSSEPSSHIMPFDWVFRNEGSLDIKWCHTASVWQALPASVPCHFVFFVMQTEFGPDDVLKLLAEWGLENSPWDLGNDGIVNGEDLMILLGG